MNMEKIKEYCNEEKPCAICQTIYNACEHETTIQIEHNLIQCLFCYDIFMTAFDTNNNAVGNDEIQ